MKKIFLAGALLVLLVGGYFYYRRLTTSPQYALAQAVKATQTHDMAEFERYVDISSVTSNLVDQVAGQGSLLGLLNPGSFAFRGALQLLKPQLVQSARQEVQAYIEKGSLESGADQQLPQGKPRISVLGLAGKLVSPDSKFKEVKYVTEQGDQALVGIELTEPKYDTTMVVELKLQDKGDHWQVKEITNTGALLKHVAQLEKRQFFRKH